MGQGRKGSIADVPDSDVFDSAVVGAPAAELPRRVARNEVRLEWLLLGIVIAAQLLPLVLLPYVPTQDGPSHQALAYALRIYDRPEGAPLRQYLERNSEALPNWFVFFLQSKVLAFVSVAAAEKILIAAYVVLLPLGLHYALRAVDRDAGFLAALGLPVTYNFLFGMGFLNFCWSLAAFLWAFGFYLRRRDRFRARDVAPMALLAAWVYFCHPLALVMLLIAVGTVSVLLVLVEQRASSAVRWWSLARDRLVLPLVSFLPVLVLLVAFVGRRLERRTSQLSFVVKAKQLFALYSLVSFDRRILIVSCGLAALIGVLAAALLWRRHREGTLRPRANDALLAVAAIFTLVYFAAPSELAGGGFVNHRLALFPPLALLLWLGSVTWSSRWRSAAQAIAVALAIGMLILLWTRWSRIDRDLDEYVAAAEHIESGRTVLPLSFAHAGCEMAGAGECRPLAFRLWPFVHALGYVAARRPIVDLGLYEAGEDYFPLRYRPNVDPYRHLSIGPVGVEEVPPRVDLAGYERSGGRIDYVVIWQPQAAPRENPLTRELYRELTDSFARVDVSEGANAELWRTPPASSTTAEPDPR